MRKILLAATPASAIFCAAAPPAMALTDQERIAGGFVTAEEVIALEEKTARFLAREWAEVIHLAKRQVITAQVDEKWAIGEAKIAEPGEAEKAAEAVKTATAARVRAEERLAKVKAEAAAMTAENEARIAALKALPKVEPAPAKAEPAPAKVEPAPAKAPKAARRARK